MKLISGFLIIGLFGCSYSFSIRINYEEFIRKGSVGSCSTGGF